MSVMAIEGGLLRIGLGLIDHGPNARGDLGDVTELARSIQALGLLEPLIVYPVDGGRFEAEDGNRRLKACRLIKRPHVEAVLRGQAAPDALRILRQVAMHTHAKPFDPIAEAKACDELMFKWGKTREEIARLLGKSPAWVRDRIALLQLAGDEQESIRKGTLPIGTALAALASRRAQRDGRPVVEVTAKTMPRPHCASCTCHARGAA